MESTGLEGGKNRDKLGKRGKEAFMLPSCMQILWTTAPILILDLNIFGVDENIRDGSLHSREYGP